MHPTILVVDSHQLYRTTFCMLLQLCWPTARIVDAADARQALAVLPQHAWDCVILDSQLPELSGGELVRHLRARAHAYGQALAPLALMAAEPGMADAARSIGPTAILRKPIERAELHAALTPVLGALSVPQGARANLLDIGAGLPAALPARRAHLSQLQEHIHSLVEQTINRFPPPYAPAAHRPLLPSCRVGDYLVQRGYLTRWQLTCALQANQSLSRGRVPLGFIVRAHNLVPSPVLSVLLLQQFGDRLAARPATPPRFIGEQLLLSADLAPAQLAAALQEQIDNYQDGRWVRLGDIIARRGWRATAAKSALIASIARRDY